MEVLGNSESYTRLALVASERLSRGRDYARLTDQPDRQQAPSQGAGILVMLDVSTDLTVLARLFMLGEHVRVAIIMSYFIGVALVASFGSLLIHANLASSRGALFALQAFGFPLAPLLLDLGGALPMPLFPLLHSTYRDARALHVALLEGPPMALLQTHLLYELVGHGSGSFSAYAVEGWLVALSLGFSLANLARTWHGALRGARRRQCGVATHVLDRLQRVGRGLPLAALRQNALSTCTGRVAMGPAQLGALVDALRANTTLEALDLGGCLPADLGDLGGLPSPTAHGGEAAEPSSASQMRGQLEELARIIARHEALSSVRLDGEWLDVAALRTARKIDLRMHGALGPASSLLIARLVPSNEELQQLDLRGLEIDLPSRRQLTEAFDTRGAGHQAELLLDIECGASGLDDLSRSARLDDLRPPSGGSRAGSSGSRAGSRAGSRRPSNSSRRPSNHALPGWGAACSLACSPAHSRCSPAEPGWACSPDSMDGEGVGEELSSESSAWMLRVQPLLAKVGMHAEELASASKVKWTSMQLDDTDCGIIGDLAAHRALESLVKLDLSYNLIGGGGMEAFTDGMARGSLPSLKFLTLDHNSIGDTGVRALASALAAGAMPQLAQLELMGCRVGDAGLDALATVVSSGMARHLVGLVVGKLERSHASLRQACEKQNVTLV